MLYKTPYKLLFMLLYRDEDALAQRLGSNRLNRDYTKREDNKSHLQPI